MRKEQHPTGNTCPPAKLFVTLHFYPVLFAYLYKEENTFKMLKYLQQTARPFGGRELTREYNIKLDITKLG
jgi:hypothetical protein